MSTPTANRLVGDYLTRLRSASRELPTDERGELQAQIAEHLRDALPTGSSDADARIVLARLGDPGELVAQYLDRLELTPRRVGRQEWFAIILLLVGGFILFVGWVAGVVLLWRSRAWTVREKLVGTLLLPGGVATALWVGLVVGTHGVDCGTFHAHAGATAVSCTGGSSTISNALTAALLIALVLVPIGSAVFLMRRARAASA